MNLQPVDFAKALAPDFMKLLASSIIGTANASEVALLSHDIATRYLDLRDPTCFFFEVSAGAVFAFVDADGRRALAKIQAPGTPLMEVEKRVAFQRYLLEHDYPCPPVLMDPIKRGDLVLVSEVFLDTGRPVDGHDASDRGLMVAGLHRLIELSRGYDALHAFPGHALAQAEGDLWPTPHNVLFDFSRPVDDATWIDELASYHWQRMQQTKGSPVIGHMDWSAKHCRVENGSLVAVYDWDSTAKLSEIRILGSALVSYTYVERHGIETRPDESGVVAFLCDYEQARGANFTDDEIDELVSSIIYSIAYGARCEAANDYGSRDTPTQARSTLRNLAGLDLRRLLLKR